MVRYDYNNEFELGAKINNKLEGRCIRIYKKCIRMGYLNEGKDDLGNCIDIITNGNIFVGQNYLATNGSISNRHTVYRTNGSS